LGGVGTFDLLSHGTIDTLIVVIESLSSDGGVSNGLEQSLSAGAAMDTSVSAATVSLNVPALWASVGVAVGL